MAFRIFKRLAELLDVDTSGVADGDALTYDAGTETWVPGAGGGGGSDDQTAAEVPFTPAGNLAANDVQEALEELDTEKASAASLTAHESDSTNVHGITNTANLLESGDTAGGVLAGTYPNPSFASDMATQAELNAHEADTTSVHGIADTSALALAANVPTNATFNDHSARHENGGADEISIAGLDGTPTELTNHLNDSSDAHDASAISVADSGGNFTATDVEAALAELAAASGGGVPALQYESRSSNTILGTADKGKTIDITATITQTFEADETLGDGWWVVLRNATDEGTVVVTLNPAGSETIDGLTTVTMYSGESRLIFCNGSGANFNSVMLSGGFARFTVDGNFVVPHGVTQAVIECIGGGGGGGGARGAASGVRNGGSGGGGGARIRTVIGAAALGNPGDTIAVDVAAGGTSGGGGSANNGSNGGVGGNTSFGSLLIAYGGGGGIGGTNASTNSTGGSGGGAGEAGVVGVSNTTNRGGGNTVVGVGGVGEAGAGGSATLAAAGSHYGGGVGGLSGGNGALGGDGGSSTFGGSGGGGGGGVTSGGAETTGGGGGPVGTFVFAASAGNGGAVNGGAGAAGTAGSLAVCGRGGAGGGGQDSGTGGVGGDGGAPGGGGGGGAAGNTVGGAGGVGGIGECRVWYS